MSKSSEDASTFLSRVEPILARDLPELKFDVEDTGTGRFKIIASGSHDELHLKRTVNLRHGILHGGETRVALPLQGRGLGRQVMINCLDMCVELGLHAMEIHAVLDGRYAWARAGFQVREDHWHTIKKALSRILASERFPDCEDKALALKIIQSDDPLALYYLSALRSLVPHVAGRQDKPTTFGKALLMSLGSWMGTFDVTQPSYVKILVGELDVGRERLL